MNHPHIKLSRLVAGATAIVLLTGAFAEECEPSECQPIEDRSGTARTNRETWLRAKPTSKIGENDPAVGVDEKVTITASAECIDGTHVRVRVVLLIGGRDKTEEGWLPEDELTEVTEN